MTTARLDPALVSIAAAHGITPRVAATWNPALARNPRVLVPIELDVLMVRNASGTWAATAMTTPPKGGGTPPVPAASLLPAPFTDLPGPRPRGAYLQWYLPNGLTSGTADGTSNSASFPPIPDRWVVLRISPGTTASRRAVRGWVLEAGGEPPQVLDLDGWTEPGTAPDVENPLTALGHGDLSWAGYFDNVVNRLGFYDGTLDSDKITGPIAYLVCGWYADPTADPLGNQAITSLAGFNAAMQRLSWTLEAGQLEEVTFDRRAYVLAAKSFGLASTIDSRIAATNATPASDATAEYVTAGSWWPTGCVLHGAVIGIDWPGSGDTAEAGGPPDPATVTVAAGNTMAEAMAAIVAAANQAPDQAAIVEALQLGVVKELDQPDGRAELDVQLHASSFASQPGGPPATEPVTIAPSGPPQAPPSDPPPPGPGIFAAHPTASARMGLSGIGFRHPAELPALGVAAGTAPTVHAEETVVRAKLGGVVSLIGAGPGLPLGDPGGLVEALRSPPRVFLPKDPILLVQGGNRAFAHDSSVPTEDGQVVCRLTPVAELSWQLPGTTQRFSVPGADVLERGVENGSVPVECEGLLAETVLLDTGSAAAISAAAGMTAASAIAERNITVEQTAWYSLRDPRVDHSRLIAHSGVSGMLPAPYSVAPAAHPWTPIHLEWSAEFVPSPRGLGDWDLGQIDYVLDPKAVVPAAGQGTVFQGRSPVTGGASNVLAAAVNNALNQAASIGGTDPVPVPAPGHLAREAFYSPLAQTLLVQFQAMKISPPPGSGQDQTAPLADIASALAQMDVLSCGLDGLLTQLRGGIPADGTSTAPGGTVPTPFFALRAGFLRLVRLRLVDGFGQFIDLCGSDASHAAQNYLVSQALSVPGQPGVLGLPPRFTAPTRAWFRFMSADTPGQEADYQTSPVCAFLQPNHLDGSLEFFNADGSPAGSLQPLDDGTVTWQDAPGLPTAAGQDPAGTLTSPYAVQLVQGLIDWGIADAGQAREPAWSALLRTIDSTLWTIDPFAHAGDEHLSLLLGHPICVIRALVRLDVADPVPTPDGTVTAVPVRLGDLTQWEDGLLGYFVDDDYTVLHAADPAAPGMARPFGPQQGFLQQINLVPGFYQSFADDLASGATTGATPVTHPYIDTSGVLLVRPNQTVNLTLLVEPLAAVHATLGLVPRKQIGFRRAWAQAGLAAIAPTFRFGPVLLDPQHIRMPLATDLNGTWVWDYRSDTATWTEDPTVNATDNALLPADPPTAIEGWLKLKPPPPGGKCRLMTIFTDILQLLGLISPGGAPATTVDTLTIWAPVPFSLDDNMAGARNPPHHYTILYSGRDIAQARSHVNAGSARDYWSDLQALNLARPDPADATKFQVGIGLRIEFPAKPGQPRTIAGIGKLPVVLLNHGQHPVQWPLPPSAGSTMRPSLNGYAYLQDALAQHGIVSVSVDHNFANYLGLLLETRADIVIAALNELAARAATPGSTYYNRLDFSRIGLMGHSRGGDAVVRTVKKIQADSTLSSKYKIITVCSLAPTDVTGGDDPPLRMYLDYNDANFYLVFYGALDGDVSGMDGATGSFGTGFRHYDRARPQKAMVFLDDCCHDAFNTVWWADFQDMSDAPTKMTPSNAHVASQATHQSLAIDYIGDLFRWQLNGEPLGARFDGGTPNSAGEHASLQWMYGQSLKRIDDFENPAANLLGGSRTVINPGVPVSIDDFASITVGTTPLEMHTGHQTHVLHVDLTAGTPASTRVLTTDIPPTDHDWSDLDTLVVSLSGWFDPTSPSTIAPPAKLPMLTVTLVDAAGATASVGPGVYGTLLPSRPVYKNFDPKIFPRPGDPFFNVTFMRLETIPIALAAFAGVDLTKITQVALDIVPDNGTHVFVDNIHAMKKL